MIRFIISILVTLFLVGCDSQYTVPELPASSMSDLPMIWQVQVYDETSHKWQNADQLQPDRLIRILGCNLSEATGVSLHGTEIPSSEFQHHSPTQIELLLPTYIRPASLTGEEIAHKLLVTGDGGSVLANFPIIVIGTRDLKNCLVVDDSVRHQYIDGFGGMNTKWQSSTLSDSEIDLLFDELGLNILRIRISPNGKNEWSQIVGTVKRACNYGAMIMATPWSPPASMKDNKSNKGGKLIDYPGYADHLFQFVNYMKDAGAPIDILSIQNEPDMPDTSESCLWSGDELVDFIAEYGDKLRTTGVKLLAAEASKFQRSYTDPILTNSSASSRIDFIGGHIYGGGLSSYPLAKDNGKRIWMTEHLRNQAWDKNGNLISAEALMTEDLAIANEIQQCMLSDFSAYLWWYLRRSYSPLLDDGNVSTRGYILSHFAKAATGFTRVEVKLPADISPDVVATAYVGEGNKASIVVLNSGENPISGIGVYYSKSYANKATVMTTRIDPTYTPDMSSEEVNVENGIVIPPFSIVTILLR